MVEFTPLAPFEERALHVVLRRGPDAEIVRTVVDGSTGKPIAGALVRIQEETRTIGGTTTDEDGVFRAHWDSWREVHLRLDAEGHAPALVSLEPGAAPQPVPLWRSAGIDFSATTATGIPLGRATVEVHGRLAEALPVELRTPSLLAEEIVDSEIRRRLSRLDPDGRKPLTFFREGRMTSLTDAHGRTSFQELPPFVPLTIDLSWNDGRKKSRLMIAPLQPGETRSVSWSEPAKSSWRSVRGRLMDQDGAPVAGHGMWLVAADEEEGERYFNCGEEPNEATTEADGTFVIGGHAGRYLLGPAPACRALREAPDPDAVAPWAIVVELVEGQEPSEVVLRRPRGLYLTCSVVDPQGKARNATVFAEVGGGAAIDVYWGPPLLLGPLLDRDHRVSAADRDSRSAARFARPVRGGGEPLELVLLPPDSEEASNGTLSGFVLDAESGEALQVDVLAIAAELAGTVLARGWPRLWKEATSDGMGRFFLDGLEPGEYVLLAMHEGSVGLARALVPGPGDRVSDVLLRVPRPGFVIVEDAKETMHGSFIVLLDSLTVERGQWYQGEPFAVPSGPILLMFTGVEQSSFRAIETSPGVTVAIDLTAGVD